MTTELNPISSGDLPGFLHEPIDRRPPPPPPVSFEAYLDWLDEDTWADLVDGEVIVHSPARDKHQDFIGFLHSLVRNHVERHDLGEVRLGPFVMRLAVPRGFEPDILFVRKDRVHLIQEYHLDGPADVAIEVVSPSRPWLDTRDKRNWYQQGGVPEYWILNQVTNTQEFLRSDGGKFQPIPVDPDGWFRSPTIAGFGFPVDWCLKWPTVDAALELLRLSVPMEKFEAEQVRADQERTRADQERVRAEQERARADRERARVQRLLDQLRRLGIAPDE